MISKDIIIIGSGISGLTIAAGLETDDFLILEARDRMGGRVFTNTNNMDMGAAWLHGCINNPLNKYLDNQNLIAVSNSNPWMHSENMPIKLLSSSGEVPDLSRQSTAIKWRNLAAQIASIPNKSIGDALRDSIQETDDSLIYSFIYMMEVWCGGSVNNIPTSFLQTDEFQNALFGDYGGSHCLFKNGASSILDTIINSAHHNIKNRIQYNKIVTNVVYGNTGVTVYTQNGEAYVCNKLCITVPPGPLKNICFSPPLEAARLHALSQIKMGSYKKVQLEFNRDEVFWGTEPMILTYNPLITGEQYYLHCDNSGDCPFILWNNYMNSKDKPVLEAVFPANMGWKLARLSDEEIIDNVIENLRMCFHNVVEPTS